METSQYILYKDIQSHVTLNVRFEDEEVWLTAAQMATLFNTSRHNVWRIIRSIYKNAELEENRTVNNLLTVQKEGNRTIHRTVAHYNMDMIIAVGFRVKSAAAIEFRQWVKEGRKSVTVEKKSAVSVRKSAKQVKA